VYVVGGNLGYPSLLGYEYDVPSSCLLINLKAATVSEKSHMNDPRCYHGLAHVNNFIYAVAGNDDLDEDRRSCERYEIGEDRWCLLPGRANFDEFAKYVSIVVAQKRHIMVFGGMNFQGDLADSSLIRSLDHLQPKKGWRVLNVVNPQHAKCVYGQGVFSLGSGGELLVFGGSDEYDEYLYAN